MVVIKEIMVTDVLSEKDKKAAMNEVQVLSMLRHPNIIGYYDSFTAPSGLLLAQTSNSISGAPAATGVDVHEFRKVKSPLEHASSSEVPGVQQTLMIVMEYADGGTLAGFLESLTEPLAEAQILRMFAQICLAVHHVHSRNILHRDLKTNNILLSGQEQSRILKIADFGISKALSLASKAESVVGTPSYLSPELCEGKSYDEKSDIWALGCILYEMICRKKLFEASNLPATVMKIMKGMYEPIPESFSPQLAQLLAVMIKPDPQDRPDIKTIISLPFMQSSIITAQLTIGKPTFKT